LRTALRAAVATIAALAALMTMAAATIETAASTASAIGTSTAIATITAATAISATAATERPLEAGARAAAAPDAGRIARLKFFTRSAAATRSAGFAGEKNFVFGRAGCRDLLRLAFELAIVPFVLFARMPVGIIFMVFVRFTVLVVFFVRRLVMFETDMVAESGDMQRVLVRGVGFRFRDGLRRANSLPGFGFVRFMFAGLVFLVVFVRFVLFVVFRLFFVNFDFFFEDRTAGDSIGLHDCAILVLLRINQAGRKSGALVVAQLGTVAVFGFVAGRLSVFHRFDFFFVEFGDVLCFGLGLFTAGFGGFRTGSSEEPAGKGTTHAAWARCCAGNNCATARLNVLRNVRLRLVDVFLDRSNGCGGYRAIAELCKRFTRKKNIVFCRAG
jgi:hypothetical protein